MRAKRARRIIRNRRELKKSNQIQSFLEIREKLYLTSLDVARKGLADHLMPGSQILSEISIRQLVNFRRHYIGIQRELLINPKDFCHPIPPEWFQILEEHGFVVSKIRSSFLWFCYVIIIGFFAVARALRELYLSFHKPQSQSFVSFVHFMKLGDGSIPSQARKKQYTIINWYANWDGRVKDVKFIRHSAFAHSNVKINSNQLEGISEDLPSLNRLHATLLLLWTIYALILALADVFRGKWWMIFGLHEAVYARKISMLNRGLLAREYFFTHEHCIYKPLWTYVAESRGSVCSIYFYSTNCHSVTPASIKEDFFRAFSYMNWQRYLVWNEQQKRRILNCARDNRFLSSEQIIPVGPINFQDIVYSLPAFKKNTVSVFDVSPARPLFNATLGQHYDYYIPKTIKLFLQNIENLRAELNFDVVLKLKRRNDKFYDQTYITLVNELEKLGWTIISSGVNARHVIEKTKISIHFPFTSTGLIAEALEKPSVYYDPSGTIDNSNTAMMGSFFVNDKKHLKKFLESHLVMG